MENSGLRMVEWLRQRPLVVDSTWALLATPLTLGGTVGMVRNPLPTWAALLWGLAFTLPVALRRVAPDVAAGLLVVALLVQVIGTDEPSPADVVVPVVLYAIGAYGRRDLRLWWLAAALVGSAAAGFDWAYRGASNGAGAIVGTVLGTITCAVSAVASYLFGALARQRRETVEALRERAESLERERESLGRLAAQEERARIAREMHDIVAHSLSVIVVQADGAKYLAAQADPSSPAVGALATIGDTAREALAETRRLVGVLREDGAAAELAPAASLDEVDELVARARAAGLAVTHVVRGTPTVLAPSAQTALYRVVQEALTNVLKHGGPGATATVEIAHAPDAVTATVRNTGAVAGPGDGAGHGIIGMRERMAAHGGELTARPLLGGGFEVVATLPRTPKESP